ncbi:GAF and ANTAR domain-containing protein [Pedococcus bigeumensis]|uniref:GAF and ANTAR domain-containing protein n=1 Tax=Pedococcus bigeumensis TaxID=433644 RepID=UPI001386D3B5|nr:GAF and ANTAR domain-containing protein [Pedococcus bigeumensis]
MVPKELDRTWQLLDDFAEVAGLLRSHTADPDIADTVCEIALKIVRGDHASITSIRSGQFTTVAATSGVPEHADKIQYKVGTGPCLDAIRADDTIRVDDLATDPRWPEFASAACSELGMHSMLAQVLPVDDQFLGAVNIYSAKTHAFDAQDEKIIAILGSAAVTAMRAVRHQEKSDHMERALHTSRRIGVALGILMVTRGVDLDGAWEFLSKASQRSNTKVSELADQIVRQGFLDNPAGPADSSSEFDHRKPSTD